VIIDRFSIDPLTDRQPSTKLLLSNPLRESQSSLSPHPASKNEVLQRILVKLRVLEVPDLLFGEFRVFCSYILHGIGTVYVPLNVMVTV
jgi:hypothetical protein